MLVEHRANGRAPRSDARELTFECTALPITEHRPGLADEPQRGIDTSAVVLREIDSAVAAVVEGGEIGLNLRFSDWRQKASPSAPLPVGRGSVDRAAVISYNRIEAIAPLPCGARNEARSAQLGTRRRVRRDALPRSERQTTTKLVIRSSDRIDGEGACEGSRTVTHSSASAARQDDAVGQRWVERDEVDPAAERVALRHTVDFDREAAPCAVGWVERESERRKLVRPAIERTTSSIRPLAL